MKEKMPYTMMLRDNSTGEIVQETEIDALFGAMHTRDGSVGIGMSSADMGAIIKTMLTAERVLDVTADEHRALRALWDELRDRREIVLGDSALTKMGMHPAGSMGGTKTMSEIIKTALRRMGEEDEEWDR